MKRLLAGMLLLALCACQPAPPTAAPVDWVQGSYCALTVEGNRLTDGAGKTLDVRGANLPSLAAMQAGGIDPIVRVRSLATAGARAVRLRVEQKENDVEYAVVRLMPFVKAANEAGVLVLLASDTALSNYNHDQFDQAEAWSREIGVYFGTNPGVWLEPIASIKTIPPLRRKNVWQRIVDVTRGFRYQNVIMISEPVWLAEGDPTLASPLFGANILYGLRTPSELPVAVRARVPWMALDFDGDPAELTGAVGAFTPPDAAKWSAWWKAGKSCWGDPRGRP